MAMLKVRGWSSRKTGFGVVRLCAIVLFASLISPAFGGHSLTDLDGETGSIADYFEPDRWLVVVIWSHSCPVCRQEIPGYIELSERQTSGDIAVLGVSIDGQEQIGDARGFVAEYDVPFPNLIGEPAVVADYYRMVTGYPFQGTPSLMLFAPGGIFRAAQAGVVPANAIEAFVSARSE